MKFAEMLWRDSSFDKELGKYKQYKKKIIFGRKSMIEIFFDMVDGNCCHSAGFWSTVMLFLDMYVKIDIFQALMKILHSVTPGTQNG